MLFEDDEDTDDFSDDVSSDSSDECENLHISLTRYSVICMDVLV